MLVLALAAAAGASATVAWFVDRRRCRHRNHEGMCAACGVSWADTTSGDPYLIHGRLVCEGCAEIAKRRMPWHFGILGASAGFVTAAIAAGEGLVALIVFPTISTIVMTVGAVQLMKLANRAAQRRIAAGEFPDFAALGGTAAVEPERSLPEASTV
jgi:hypothetical protein